VKGGSSAVTVTVVASLLVLTCATLCSATGIYALTDQGGTIDIHSTASIPLICLGLLFWITPPLLWLVMARGKEDRMPEE
jgi:hypothetical protein